MAQELRQVERAAAEERSAALQRTLFRKPEADLILYGANVLDARTGSIHDPSMAQLAAGATLRLPDLPGSRCIMI